MPETDDFANMHTTIEKLEQVRQAIGLAFTWKATMDGTHFWADIVIRLNEMEEAYKEWKKSQP